MTSEYLERRETPLQEQVQSLVRQNEGRAREETIYSRLEPENARNEIDEAVEDLVEDGDLDRYDWDRSAVYKMPGFDPV